MFGSQGPEGRLRIRVVGSCSSEFFHGVQGDQLPELPPPGSNDAGVHLGLGFWKAEGLP